jgi:hypothetical protein
MAIDSSDSSVDEDNRVSDVFSWICRRKKDTRERKKIVEKYNVCMVARYCTRRNKRGTTYNLGSIGKTIWNVAIYCLRSDVFLCILLGIFLGSVGTNPRNWVSMAATRN